MKKILIYILPLLLIVSCGDDESINIDTKNPATATGEVLFANAQKNLFDQMTSINVNQNPFRFFAQYVSATTYTDEPNYNITTRTIPDNHWETLYEDVLKDFSEANDITTTVVPLNNQETITKQNQLAIINIMIIYTYQVLVDTFGNIPFSEALDITNFTPTYDDGLTIYQNLIIQLDENISQLDSSGSSFNTDLMYSGDINSWIKFANSLKLKLGMTLADVDVSLAKTTVESAASNVFSSNSDNARIIYSSSPNQNPLFKDVINSGRQDFIPANTIIDAMNTLEDPRLPQYFTLYTEKDANNTIIVQEYRGGTYGVNSGFSDNSHIGDILLTPEFEALILDYSEVEFFLAEAVERGFNVGGTAEEHYNKAITSSINYWASFDTSVDGAVEAANYLANPEVAYSTAEGDYKQKIGTQKWIALYNRGFEGWTEWRRLDFPTLVAPPDAVVNEVPKRFTYPINEQTLNSTNYSTAASAIGGDLLTTKLFWDVN